MNYLSILSTILAFAFTLAVFNRYLNRRRTYLLLWALGLLFYGLGTLSEVILTFTYSTLVLKLWYLTGAMLTAAWLGQGTVHLLVRKGGLPRALTALLTAISLVAVALIFQAPVTGAAESYAVSEPASAQYQEILVRSGLVTALTIFLNIYGTLALVGGALYSAFLFWRKRVLANRMFGNILIAGGALMPALGGSFLKAGLADWLYLSELLGVILMYAGFLLATTGAAAESRLAPTTVTDSS